MINFCKILPNLITVIRSLFCLLIIVVFVPVFAAVVVDVVDVGVLEAV